MAQEWYVIPGSEQQKDSLPKLNANYETLRSNFEGNDYPATPVKGQHAFIAGAWYTYNGAVWVNDNTLHNHDTRYYTESEIDTFLLGKSNTTHNHHDDYYTETEIDTLLSGLPISGHTHDDRYFTETEMNVKLAAKADTHTHPYAATSHGRHVTSNSIAVGDLETGLNVPLPNCYINKLFESTETELVKFKIYIPATVTTLNMYCSHTHSGLNGSIYFKIDNNWASNIATLGMAASPVFSSIMTINVSALSGFHELNVRGTAGVYTETWLKTVCFYWSA